MEGFGYDDGIGDSLTNSPGQDSIATEPISTNNVNGNFGPNTNSGLNDASSGKGFSADITSGTSNR